MFPLFYFTVVAMLYATLLCGIADNQQNRLTIKSINNKMDAMAPEHACKISRIKIAHWPIIK